MTGGQVSEEVCLLHRNFVCVISGGWAEHAPQGSAPSLRAQQSGMNRVMGFVSHFVCASESVRQIAQATLTQALTSQTRTRYLQWSSAL